MGISLLPFDFQNAENGSPKTVLNKIEKMFEKSHARWSGYPWVMTPVLP